MITLFQSNLFNKQLNFSNFYYKIPVSLLIGFTLIFIFLLYYFSILTSFPCKNTFFTILKTNFVHVDFKHLMNNLFALFFLSLLELKYGTKTFIFIVFLMLVINACLETIAHNLYPSIPCAIGFSGILISLIMFYLMKQKATTYVILMFILTIAIFDDKNVSQISHILGGVTGIITSQII